MATTLFYTDTLSALTIIGKVIRTLSSARGAGVVTKTQTSVTTTTNVFDTGTTPLGFAIRVNAVTLAATAWTINVWGSESALTANNGACLLNATDAPTYMEVRNNDGSLVTAVTSGSGGASAEYGTTPAARTPTTTPASTALTDGQWLVIYPQHRPVGTGLGTKTITCSYSGTTGAADGDSFITFPDTITAFVASADQPFVSPYLQLLAQ